MELRDCAARSTAFGQLLAVYEDREMYLREWKDKGEKVIGLLGADVPEELLVAAGLHVVWIYALPGGNLPLADQYLEYAFDPMVRAQFEKLVDGTYSALLDGIVISNSTDVLIRLYLYLRELKRTEPERGLPDVAYIDWLFSRNLLYQQYNEKTLARFREQLEAWAGRCISDEEIKEASALCNRRRHALRKLNALRTAAEPRVSGSEMLVAIGSGLFMDVREHAQLIEQLAQEASYWPKLERVRLYYTGSAQVTTDLYQFIEHCGYVIVGEDHDWGDRFYERDTNPDLPVLRALVDRYMLREFSSKKSLVAQRVKALDGLVHEAKAEAVLFYTHVYEEPASWDYPSQKESLLSSGIGTIHAAKMNWPLTDPECEELKEKLRVYARERQEGAQDG